MTIKKHLSSLVVVLAFATMGATTTPETATSQFPGECAGATSNNGFAASSPGCGPFTCNIDVTNNTGTNLVDSRFTLMLALNDTTYVATPQYVALWNARETKRLGVNFDVQGKLQAVGLCGSASRDYASGPSVRILSLIRLR